MNALNLSADLEKFASDAVAQGRYRDATELMEAALKLLQQLETERTAFILSLDQAQAEGERDGFATLEQVDQEMRAIIEATCQKAR